MGRKLGLEKRMVISIKADKDKQTSVAQKTIELLSDLDPRERKILSQRYGIDDHTGATGEILIKNYLKGFDTGFDQGVKSVYNALLNSNSNSKDISELQKGLEAYLGYKHVNMKFN